MTADGTSLPTMTIFAGGMSAGEAVVFWLGGFSSDPKYPISGEGGPSYRDSDHLAIPTNRTLDPIESRKWIFPFEVARLRPRTDDDYFDEIGRSIHRIHGHDQRRRPATSHQFLAVHAGQVGAAVFVFRYVAASGRRSSTAMLLGPYDPPAATAPNLARCMCHAFKKRSESADADACQSSSSIQTSSRFCTAASTMRGATELSSGCRSMTSAVRTTPSDYLLFPDGPFTGDIADTIVNFSDRDDARGRAEVMRVRSRGVESRDARMQSANLRMSRLATAALSTLDPPTLDLSRRGVTLIELLIVILII